MDDGASGPTSTHTMIMLSMRKRYGVRYMKFVGDGDSCVHSTLLQNVPGWGHDIKKLECANHACKCYRGALERLVQDNPSYKGNGSLTKRIRKKLVSAARSAIQMCSKEVDQKKALASLKHDLENGPLVFISTVVQISVLQHKSKPIQHPSQCPSSSSISTTTTTSGFHTSASPILPTPTSAFSVSATSMKVK